MQTDAKKMPPSMLVSATYDNVSKSAVLKFYEPKTQELFLWKDETGHKPYCYSRLEPDNLGELQKRDDVLDIKSVKKYDLIADMEIDMSKITVADPLAIGGTAGVKSIRNTMETWESDIKYYESYLYDRNLIVGKYYEIADGKVAEHDMEISDEVKLALKSMLWDKMDDESMADAKQFKEFISEWANLLNQPIPKIKRLAVDIEVEAEMGRIPDPKAAEKKVTAIGLKGTDGFDRVFVLRTEGTDEGTDDPEQKFDVSFYEAGQEQKMIRDAFEIIKTFPFVVTYNGDEFDLPYLYNRAEVLGIKNADNPLYMMRDSATLKEGVHLDLYRALSNRSFQTYAFSQKYTDFSLNSVSKALLGKGKIDYGLEFDELSLYQTANYCYNDALLTYELTSFNGDLLMNLLVIVARIGRMPIDDIARMGVSQWIRSLLYYEHRKRNCLIPKREELQRRSEGVISDAVIKDKKYRGGLVVDPKEGIHFDVVVMDFASLYPSIIKVRNLSYETVRCVHEECKKNTIPQTNHWACSKRNGLTAMIIGSLRDLRVNYYKSLSKKETLTDEQRQQYTVVSQALKVILNASYGVMGAEIFPLYFLPVAEATTAIGRHTILETIKKCEGVGVEVLYGDSVLGDTPIVCEIGGKRQIIPIKAMVAKSLRNSGKGRQKHASAKILSDDRLVDVGYGYVHKVKKTGYRVYSRKGYVELTEDHSLIIDGVEKSPRDLKVGDRIDLMCKTDVFRNDVRLSTDLAWLFGLYVAKGACGESIAGGGTVKKFWAISNRDSSLLSKARGIIREHLGIETHILDCKSNDGALALKPIHGSIQAILDYFLDMCHVADEKVVPEAVLNGTPAVKQVFFDGMVAGDGHGKESDLGIGQIHKSVMAGIAHILEELGHDYSFGIREGKPEFIRIKVIRNRADSGVLRHDVIKSIEKFEIDGNVYDLSTDNGHFRGGLGNVLLHNTDSIFIKKPTEAQIQQVIEQAKKDHSVDLEIDKVYRYCVLSNRKKNYLGVTKTGKVDVKGLTGKKSHTPQFIKKLFYELLDVLSEVQTADDFEKAKQKITEKIATCGKRLEAKEIPVEELTFNVTMSKAPSEYVKAIPQHIRAARQLGPDRELKKGDKISYIKTQNKPGVKPAELAKKEEIDSKKYMEFMESTLEQITSSMDLDFDAILGKPKQIGLDEFFWS